MEIEILHAKSLKSLGRLSGLKAESTIMDVKLEYEQIKPGLYPDRQSFRADPKSKMLKDETKLSAIGFGAGGNKLYFRDLGPQVGWTTVFLTEYAGPLFIYLLFYMRPALIYGAEAAKEPKAQVVHIACACWTFHYAKRLFETVFIHRFSHATMPISNIVKNSTYYWGFAAFVAYFINHPLYTAPCANQTYTALAGFVVSELGNFSIHVALRNLRPPGTKERRIPYPTSNPLTLLFKFVSCPNYTYEFYSWLSFTIMTQSLPALLFTIAGVYQMTVWAMGKHRNYRKEFKEYPRGRKSIIPFLI
ncbi:hypothetical protein CAPTEDRAFT_167372 [Capitella teleta]|uniref:very-long-chain enoyl-CoA reductase n=1 Tax=Capitella teleta TaxID=283909 RepID=R7TFQ4_CAPTE|nr:hypothetical protein CAPTEDRAFT_167372 [Capitella teleta]|eukprot:ELT92574.1 hypothetical protein CAPTEDRAFT_167372 [Capitella teleta]